MPDLIENQLHTDIEHQNISSLLEDRFTRHCVAKNAGCKTHGKNTNPYAHHDHPDLVGKGDCRHNIINTEDQVHQLHGQHGCPKRLDLDRLEIVVFLTASA